MAVQWNCDICGVATQVNPPSEPVYEEKEMVSKIPDPEHIKTLKKEEQVTEMHKWAHGKYNGPTVDHKVIQKLPKMAKMKRQNPQTGEMETVEVQEIKDLIPRAYITQLTVGPEMVQRDFCKECLKKEILPLLQPLWDKLESIRSK